MSPKKDVSEERKSQILEAAMDTFSDRGFHKTRMSDIAEASELSKGSLYWYFDSKDSIILSLLDKFFEPEIADFKVLLTAPGSAEKRLNMYVERVSDDMVKMLRWMPLLYDFIALAFRKEQVKKAVFIYYQKQREILIDLIQQGIDKGEFQAEDAATVAVAIGSIIEGMAFLWMYDLENIDIKHHIQASVEILLRGLTIKDPQVFLQPENQ